MSTNHEYTPTTDLMRQWHVLADHSGNKSTEEYEAEFDRWYQAEIAAAEQRGAERALREAAEHVATLPDRLGDHWLKPHTVSEFLNYRADQEGVDE